MLTLALGIGANTAIFSVVNAVLLRPLPYPEPSQLVALWEKQPGTSGASQFDLVSELLRLALSEQSFERMASYYTNDVALTGVATPVNLRSAVVSPELFAVLGVQPRLGRWFVEEEERPGARAVIINHGLWQRQFGSDPNIVGSSLTLDGKPFTVVGVMPEGFQFPIEADPTELWLASSIDGEKSDPAEAAQNEQRGSHFLGAIGRLKPGVSIDDAQAEMTVIGGKLEQQYPDTNTRRGVKLVPYHNDLVHDYSEALWLILGAVGCVLLIACVNVANLLLSPRDGPLQRDRGSGGAGSDRSRIVRQLLTRA